MCSCCVLLCKNKAQEAQAVNTNSHALEIYFYSIFLAKTSGSGKFLMGSLISSLADPERSQILHFLHHVFCILPFVVGYAFPLVLLILSGTPPPKKKPTLKWTPACMKQHSLIWQQSGGLFTLYWSGFCWDLPTFQLMNGFKISFCVKQACKSELFSLFSLMLTSLELSVTDVIIERKRLNDRW